MVVNSQAQIRRNIMAQLKESFGRVVYTYTTHNKYIDNLYWKKKWLNRIEISLTAISTSGIISSIFVYNELVTIFTAIISTILLALRILNFNDSLDKNINLHANTSLQLWYLREEYLSLMNDFENDIYTIEETLKKRDLLTENIGDVYKTAPRTNSKSYSKAQNALQNEEEQYFSEKELQKMLPPHLR